MEEAWKEIPGFLGYKVSNQGQVCSYFYPLGNGKWGIAESPQRILRPSSSNGRHGINLRKNGETHYCYVGRLVLLAFVGPPPDGMETCHNDSNPANDHLTNLRWDTHLGNMQDRVGRGGRRRRPKLNQEEVHTIRTVFASGKHSRMELAKEFGVSLGIICTALTGRGAYEGGLGSIQKCTRLTNQQAEAIRRERVSGKSLANLAEKYGISESAISLIASGKRHGNAGGPRVRPYEICCAA